MIMTKMSSYLSTPPKKETRNAESNEDENSLNGINIFHELIKSSIIVNGVCVMI